MSDTYRMDEDRTDMPDAAEEFGEPDRVAHGDDHRGNHQGPGPHQAIDFEAEREARLAAIKRIAERNNADLLELSQADRSLPRPDLEKPSTFAYAEQAMTMIDDPANKLTADGRARAAYDLVVMLAGDDNISTQAFSMYVSRLRLEAPEALAACAQRLLTSGTFFLTAGTNAVHTTMPRLSEVIRLHLATDLGLQRPVYLLKLETAIESLIQSRLLAHRATLLCDGLAAMSEAELVLRRQAAECQRVFIRLLDELETVSRGTGRAAFRATLADKAVARPVITELGPSVRGLHRGGRRKDEATQKA